MQKVLRSLIHEVIPEDLRFDIALLNKRRDILNDEKQEELFNLLRKYGIENITPLGPGTNRYAFKLNGFVVKVATDNDGIIDNMKEFKMIKLLNPRNFIHVNELAENGTLEICEYIQPFGSYGEMYQYADRIREVLRELSDMGYLIGDVGITAKNYANWGLRIGSDEPVCLDFAYIYDVKSELFLCRKCNTGAMLFPDKDFVKLVCPNKSCGAVYEFSDIRRRIGNDIHMQEIGDLSQISYVMEGSNIQMELSPDKSQYLKAKEKKQPKMKPVSETVVELDNFELEHEMGYYLNQNQNIMEERNMKLDMTGVSFRGPVVKARVLTTPTEPEVQDDVAFSGKIEDDPTVIKAFVITEHKTEETTEPKAEEVPTEPAAEEANEESLEDIAANMAMNQSDTTEIGEPVHGKTVWESLNEMSKEITEKVIDEVKSETAKEEPVQTAPINVEVKSVVPVVAAADDKENVFMPEFIDKAHYAVSNYCKAAVQRMEMDNFFATIKNYLRIKMFIGDFSKNVSTAMYKAIIGFCNFKQIDIPNKEGTGTHRGYVAPDTIVGEVYEPTMLLLQRIFLDDQMSTSDDIKAIMDEYSQQYQDVQGLQREIIPLLRTELKKRIKIDDIGLDKIIEYFDKLIFEQQEVADLKVVAQAINEANAEIEAGYESPLKKQLDEEIAKAQKEETPTDIQKAFADTIHSVIGETATVESQQTEEEVAFESSIEDGETEEVEEAEDDYVPTIIEIYHEDDTDIIRLNGLDAFGPICIPFYEKLDDVDVSKTIPSLADERNGIWDWLAHLAPMMMFRTKDPDKWINANENVIAPNQAHTVILDQEESGDYIMGLYILDDVSFVNEDGTKTLATIDVMPKLNKIFLDGLATTPISHLKRTVVRKDIVVDESIVSSYLVDADEESDDLSDAALNAVLDSEEPAPVVDVPAENTAEAPVETTTEEAEESMIFEPIRKK